MLTTERFIQAARRVHGTLYDYTNTEYTGSTIPVIIGCPTHGSFTQIPTVHTFNKSGCPACSNVRKGAYHKKDTQWFITEGQRIHGNKYDYSKVNYQRYHDKVEIVCSEHGSFLQTAGGHISQHHGCPTCSVEDYEGGYGEKRFQNHPEIKNRPAMLYVIECTGGDERFIKLGITQHSLHHRFHQTNTIPYTYVELTTLQGQLYDMFKLEQKLKKQFKQRKYRPHQKFNGHTECLHVDTITALIRQINTAKEQS